jgi:MFS family permease
MITVLRNSWPLLLGVMLLMLGNGLQSSLLGVRGETAGFSAVEMSFIMSAYFVGFMISSRVTPIMIRRVGHVRVFAALASFISAVIILYPAVPHPLAWILGRVWIGFCFCGVYVTAESWLNNAATNETRGQSLSLYMIVQMVGIIAAQGLLNIPDPSGFLLFVIPSVLVSVSFAPILLAVSPTPAFDATKPMKLIDLFRKSPLGCVGMLLSGSVFAAQFGMSAVFGAQAGLNVQQISIFVAAFYVGALVFQFPIGWLSDRSDRRILIGAVSGIGAMAAFIATFFSTEFYLIVLAAFFMGGMGNPLYALLIAHTNDFLEPEDMASASGGLLFINGLGAVAGPVVTGVAMERFGPQAFFLLFAIPLFMLAAYAIWRMTRRPAISSDDTGVFAPMSPTGTVVAMEFAQEYATEAAEIAAEEEAQNTGT